MPDRLPSDGPSFGKSDGASTLPPGSGAHDRGESGLKQFALLSRFPILAKMVLSSPLHSAQGCPKRSQQGGHFRLAVGSPGKNLLSLGGCAATCRDREGAR